MSGASESSGAFDSSDLEREHLSTLDEQGRRLYLEAREDRLRRAEMGEVFGPPPPAPVGGASTAMGANVFSESPITARRRSRTPPRVSRRLDEVASRQSQARADRRRRHLLQASKVCLPRRAAPTMLRFRSQTPAPCSLIFRFVWSESRVEVLQPSLSSLCDWEPGHLPELIQSSTGVPAVWRQHFSFCDSPASSQHVLLMSGNMCNMMHFWAAFSVATWVRLLLSQCHCELYSHRIPSAQASPESCLAAPTLCQMSETTPAATDRPQELSSDTASGTGVPIWERDMPTQMRSWSKQPCWLRPLMAGRKLLNRWPRRKWTLVRRPLAVGARGVPLRLMFCRVPCRALLLPLCLCQRIAAQESALPQARLSWSQHRKPLGSSTLSSPFVLPRHISWVPDRIDPASGGSSKKPTCLCSLPCTSALRSLIRGMLSCQGLR